MRKRDNFPAINEMKKMLNIVKKQTLNEFIMPEEDSFEEDYREEEPYNEEVLMRNDNDMSNIEKELIQIRKIALSVINRLADQTSSESYNTMKRIWALVDKAIENKNEDVEK